MSVTVRGGCILITVSGPKIINNLIIINNGLINQYYIGSTK